MKQLKKFLNSLKRKLLYAGREWAWQFVFPSSRTFSDDETGEPRRHHMHEKDEFKSIKNLNIFYQVSGCWWSIEGSC